MIAQDGFIEYCEVHTNMYGTAKAQIRSIQDSKKIPLLDIDVQGAIKFQKVFPDSNFVGIIPPSVEALKARLVKRGTEKPEQLETRLKNAPGELEQIMGIKDTFRFRVINDDIEVSKMTINRLINALYRKELTPVVKAEPKQGWNPLYQTAGVVIGLVLVHEIVRTRKQWM